MLADVVGEAFDVLLIEAPDPTRGPPERSWVSLAADIARRANSISRVAIASPGAACTGAAEYAARLEHGLPTFFDYLPRIEVLAHRDQRAEFIELFPEQRRVPGNKVFQERLDGRFAVEPGANSLKFFIYLETGQAEDVREATAALPNSPRSRVPISLSVEQRPASGHALVEVLTQPEGLLGPQRLTLNWPKMTPTGMRRAEVLQQLEENRPHGFPDHAPSTTHWAVWESLRLDDVIRRYNSVQPQDARYAARLDELRKALGRKINPRFTGFDDRVNLSLAAFDSTGFFVPEPGRDAAVTRLKEKIDRELMILMKGGSDKISIRHLCFAGSWLFANCPEYVLMYMRNLTHSTSQLGTLTQAVGRTFHTKSDIKMAFAYLARRLSERKSAVPPFNGSMNELKAAAMILLYREDGADYFEPSQATVVAEAALHTITNVLRAKTALQQKFLWAATAFLAVLRYRRVSPTFMSPDDELTKDHYRLAEGVLKHAQLVITHGRACHPLVKNAINEALLFLNKKGGDTTFLTLLSRALDNSEVGDEET
jgi:hypothetical protein